MASQWYCKVLGQEVGPVGFQDMAEMIRSGTLKEDDRVRRKGTDQWIAASDVTGLFRAARKQPAQATPAVEQAKPASPPAEKEAQPRPSPQPRRRGKRQVLVAVGFVGALILVIGLVTAWRARRETLPVPYNGVLRDVSPLFDGEEEGFVRSTRDPHGVEHELALQFDFSAASDDVVVHVSGNEHSARLREAEIVDGRRGKALKLDGRGELMLAPTPHDLSPDLRPLVVGAWCKPADADGVIVSMGGRTQGFSLFLRNRVPHFASRVSRRLSEAVAPEPVALDEWVHLAGVLDVEGTLSLCVNGQPVAQASGALMTRTPTEGMTVGADLEGTVGDHEAPFRWRGLLEDVRLYWGPVDAEKLLAWAE